MKLSDIEFKRYSQHGEDGIIAFLTSAILEPNFYFIEIGCADGRENNSSFLLENGYRGIAIDGDVKKIQSYLEFCNQKGWSGRVIPQACMINFNNVVDIFSHFSMLNPDVFSLDIDGIDYYVMSHLLIAGFRPRIICLEYNACFRDLPVVVDYNESFSRWAFHKSGMYYGTSVASWKQLLSRFGYHFITVDSSGTNCFFVDMEAVDGFVISALEGEDYLESDFYNRTRRGSPAEQFANISHLPFYDCEELLENLLASVAEETACQAQPEGQNQFRIFA